jgi:hypothetical protein
MGGRIALELDLDFAYAKPQSEAKDTEAHRER